VESAGRRLGRELMADRGQSETEEALGRILTALGFAPQRERRNAARVLFRLGNCPYREAARENQPVVCGLHRGLTLGLLDQLDPGARLSEFSPMDPDRAGCVIQVDGLDGA
jgi:predicted ArsR family transcriptional regulator